MKNVAFWNVVPGRSCGDAGFSLADFSTLRMEEMLSSETLVHTRSTWHHIPEDGILHSYCRKDSDFTHLFMNILCMASFC
jgi:hypothetical protein